MGDARMNNVILGVGLYSHICCIGVVVRYGVLLLFCEIHEEFRESWS